ncbi:MAG: hypothetical protein HUK20_01095 [Fibrobacter sp.]|nr:hypothetical protein [Fibrobacter sp.]
MKQSPLRNLRKTTIVALAVLLSFFLHRVVIFFMDGDVVVESTETELSLAQSVLCSHIVNGSPFGIDSVFEEGSRLYYYSTVSAVAIGDADTLMHIWFNGPDTVQKSFCKLSQESCYTSISPKLLKPGEWSVDLVAERKLLSTRQFVVESVHR